MTQQATQTARAARRMTSSGLGSAVRRSKTLSKAGMLEWLFARAFSGLVYPQIWEDPVVDMAALQLKADDHVVAIASGVLQHPLLSHGGAGPRQRRRPQRGAYRARPAEARGAGTLAEP